MTATIQAQDGARTTPPAKAKKPADPRYLALRNFAISISAFNVFGYTLLGFEQPWLFALFAVITGYTFDLSLETISAWAYKRRPEFRGRMRHFLVPSTLGITRCLLVFARWLTLSAQYVFSERASSCFRLFIPIVILLAGTVLNTMLTKRVALIVGWMKKPPIQPT